MFFSLPALFFKLKEYLFFTKIALEPAVFADELVLQGAQAPFTYGTFSSQCHVQRYGFCFFDCPGNIISPEVQAYAGNILFLHTC